ncbi:MAG: potassium transporter TrkA [Chloroflexi bacterium]|nr:potassium transporter TrkA [Chloroflexota bacterium]
MVTKPTFRQRLQYFFDNFMSRGTVALIGGLAFISFLLIATAGLVIAIGGHLLAPEGSDPPGFLEAVWLSLMRTLDAGTMGGDAGWGFRLVMLVVTLGGVFIVSALIGVLTTGVEGKMDELRKGRSRVLESGHILILGWSAQVFTVLTELLTANENQPNARIVILAERDKVEMEDEIRSRVDSQGRKKIICRSGSPIDLTDIEIASPHAARAIIILPPEDDDPDSHVIKTVLALTNNPNRRPEPYHIVTQIRDPRNMNVVRMIGVRDTLLAIQTGELIARVVAQTSRQSGLSVVYTELMNFGGDEIYFKSEPVLNGKTFGETLLLYEDSSILGLRSAAGTVSLNPPMETRLAEGDQVIALSADDDTVKLSNLPASAVDETSIGLKFQPHRASLEKCLILGWNDCATTIIRELDHYVPKGSKVLVVADPSVSDEASEADDTLRRDLRRLKNQKVDFHRGDTTDRELLEDLKAADYDHIIVLSYAGLEVQAADAKTLVTLLHLRNIAEKDATPFSIVSEMLDLRNRELAEAARVDDFIVSEHLISLMMAQLAENAELMAVFTDIFDPEGCEIYLKPASQYVDIGKPTNFYTVVESARRRGHLAFGYRLGVESGEAAKAYGVHTNPQKSMMVSFTPEDKIIVLAED